MDLTKSLMYDSTEHRKSMGGVDFRVHNGATVTDQNKLQNKGKELGGR